MMCNRLTGLVLLLQGAAVETFTVGVRRPRTASPPRAAPRMWCDEVAGRPAQCIPRRTVVAFSAKQPSDDQEPDLFDYFDPLLSPHAYPKGITPVDKPDDLNKVGDADDAAGRKANTNDPFQFRKAQKLHQDDNDNSSIRGRGGDPDRPPVDTDHVFDPTISPHAYTQGAVPDVVVGDQHIVENDNGRDAKDDALRPPPQQHPPISPKKGRIGVLLIDHGSKNIASNERLHDVAAMYQERTLHDRHVLDDFIVRAAHMEIATPSISDGLQTLLQHNVTKIICHPYFLSPGGRHVQDDIPNIIAQAVRDLDIAVPVRTTPPTGAHTDVMLKAIDEAVLNVLVP